MLLEALFYNTSLKLMSRIYVPLKYMNVCGHGTDTNACGPGDISAKHTTDKNYACKIDHKETPFLKQHAEKTPPLSFIII